MAEQPDAFWLRQILDACGLESGTTLDVIRWIGEMRGRAEGAELKLAEAEDELKAPSIAAAITEARRQALREFFDVLETCVVCTAGLQDMRVAPHCEDHRSPDEYEIEAWCDRYQALRAEAANG